MTLAKSVLFVVCTLAWIRLSNANCYTPWGSQGHCVNIKKCEQLYGLLRQRPLPPAVLNVLRTARCGFEGFDPKVCCETMSENSIDSATPAPKLEPVTVKKELPTTTTTMTPTTTATAPPTLVPLEDHPNRRLLADDLCGPIAEGRIYGGNETAIHEFPWMALLGYDVGTERPEFRCGASLINKHYVLTAAHCATSLAENMKLVSVRIGDYDLSSERDCDEFVNGVGFNCAARYQEFAVDRVHVHPEFSKRKLHNDIALVRLNGEADMTPANVRPICLPLGRAAALKARKVVVTGWGSTEFGVRSEKLLKVTLPIVTTDKCRAAYRRQVKIWHKQICAGGTSRMDSCSGDSGGPLQAMGFYGGKPRVVQYGIVSFGPHSCGIDGFPGVYTSVAHYVHWILDQMTD